MQLSTLARRMPDKAAVIDAASGDVTTFAELDRRSLQIAQLLAASGLGRGDHIAIMMDNRPEYFEIVWAAQRRGIYTTPVNWHLTEAEAAYVVADCGAQALFTSATVADLAERVAARSDRLVLKVMVGTPSAGFVGYDDACSPHPAEPVEPEVEGAYFLYSSGTTGAPKGIKPDHDFPPFGTGLAIDNRLHDAFGFDDSVVYLCPAPLYHAAPIAWSMGTIRNGGSVVLMARFDALECLRAIERYGVTHAQFVPTMFVRMLKLSPAERAQYDLSSLKVAVHAAAPCPVDVKQAMIDWLGPVLLVYYAGSEGLGMTVIDSQTWLSHPGSVGRATLGVIHIVDTDGTELPVGEIGTVYFEGGAAFEYHNDVEKTAKAFNGKGWATLGDMGHVDAEGFLYLADRRTDLILSGGVNIYPREIEDALIMHPAVADVAVIGIPDPEMGQQVKAVVQLASGGQPDDALRAALVVHCRERLAGFKCPREWEFVDAFPRTESGKLVRRHLRPDSVSAG
jgi:long-chain acyl-CoA synthetase